jgi:hypothetical protein
MPEPTDEQLKHYAAELPKIYKYVLEAFAKASVRRRAGEPLPISVINQWVMLKDDYFRMGDVEEAIKNLRERGFLTLYFDEDTHDWDANGEIISDDVQPTELGEKLITALTGIGPVRNVVPKLPELAWN